MKSTRLTLSIALAVLYNFFFWQEKLGINLLIFSLILILANFSLNPKALKSIHALLIALGTLISGVMVVLHNSGTSKVVHILSVLLLVIMTHYPQMKSMAHAFGQTFHSFFGIFNTFRDRLNLSWIKDKQVHKWSQILKLSVIPFCVLLVFYFLFFLANPKFAEASTELSEALAAWFGNFSLIKILFFISGLWISAFALLPNDQPVFPDLDATSKDQLERRRLKHNHAFALLDLKKEYMVGVLLVGMVNALLLINNILDIQWLWFNFELPAGINHTQLVHEGTYLLIFSILLAMGIMLYFYRGNQNFFKQGKTLKYLTYAWIFQNLILVVSVGIRNYHYIASQGLASKRIGVIFFLLLVVFGLATLLLKIRDKMSFYYLLKVNSWAVYVVGISLCLINWDGFIAKYNFDHYEQTGNLTLDLSGKTLPIILSHEEIVRDYYHGNQYTNSSYLQKLRRKENHYLDSWRNRSWLSWNYADYKAMKWLNTYRGSNP